MEVRDLRTRIAGLQRRLADLRARVPAYSLSAAMAIELEMVQGALAALRKELDGKLQLCQS